jgi:hypothetical protein
MTTPPIGGGRAEAAPTSSLQAYADAAGDRKQSRGVECAPHSRMQAARQLLEA